jgi:hypothetical protein
MLPWGGVFAARVQFMLCGLATIYLTHHMAATMHGVPTEEGCVSSGRLRLSWVLWEAEMNELY